MDISKRIEFLEKRFDSKDSQVKQKEQKFLFDHLNLIMKKSHSEHQWNKLSEKDRRRIFYKPPSDNKADVEHQLIMEVLDMCLKVIQVFIAEKRREQSTVNG